MVKWFEKLTPKLFNFVVCNPCQSSPSLTILVPNYGLLLHVSLGVFPFVQYYFQVSFNLKVIFSHWSK